LYDDTVFGCRVASNVDKLWDGSIERPSLYLAETTVSLSPIVTSTTYLGMAQNVMNTYVPESARSIAAAAFGSGALTIVFTTPQIIVLSQKSKSVVLPPFSSAHLVRIFKRAIFTQTGNKCVHFGAVRALKKTLDQSPGGGFGKYNINVAYGFVSVPVQAWAYNSLNADVFQYFGRSQAITSTSWVGSAQNFFHKKIRPGFVWTWLRDTNSIGGSLILGPILAAKLCENRQRQRSQGGDQIEILDPSQADRFAGGLISGVFCGFATQCFHNAALVGGRAAELGEHIGTFDCMTRLFKELGMKSLYQGIQYRVVVIAGISALVNWLEPFR
jgi:hypothetical protein